MTQRLVDRTLICFGEQKAVAPLFGSSLADLVVTFFVGSPLWFTGCRRGNGQTGGFYRRRVFEIIVEVDEILRASEFQRFFRSATEDQLATHEQHDLVEELDVLHRMS